MPRAVDADERDALPALYDEADVVKDDVVSVAFFKPLGLYHFAPAARTLGELEADALLRPFELRYLHFFELFYAALHLARLRRLVAEALDEFLYFFDFFLLLFPLRFEARAGVPRAR